jgi:hypothetical protein
MDASLASALLASRVGQFQLAIAGRLLASDLDSARSVVKLIDAAQHSFDRLANVAAGIGTQLDVTT